MTNPVAGLKAFRRIQLVTEGATPGTAVTTATARLIGTLKMKQTQKYYRPNDLETGKLSDYERSIIVGTMAELPFESDANYEQLGYLLNMAIMPGVKTGEYDSQYVWTYKPHLTTANAPTTYTIQYGDDIQEFYSAFCFAKDIEISGSLDDAVKVKAGLIGDYVRKGTFTALANPTALNPVVCGTGKLYIDTTWAGLGGTVQPATLVDFSYKVSEGMKPVKYGNGDLFYSDRAETKRHVELNLTVAFNSVSNALWTQFTASPQTHVFIRLEFTGPLIGMTAHDVLDLDGCFVIDDYDTLSDRDGQDIVKLKLLSEYDPTGTAEWQVILKNALTALP